MFTGQQVRFDAGETYGRFRHMHLKSINVGIDMHVTLRPQRVAASGARARSFGDFRTLFHSVILHH